jgi:hypothetical protein
MVVKITNPHTKVLYDTWRRIRQPFTIPPDKTTHQCGNSWEKFDIDKAGCIECGKYHLCEHGECDYVMTEDSLVCFITGLCVKPKILTSDEHVCVAVHRSNNFLQFTSESGNSSLGKNNAEESQDRRCKAARDDALIAWQSRNVTKRPMHVQSLYNSIGRSTFEDQMQIVFSILKNIMCSEKTKLSIHRENKKLRHQLRGIIPQTLRACKIMKKTPSICDLETQLRRSNSIGRIPPSESQWDVGYMCKLANQAAVPITRLILFMRTFCSNVPICVRQNTIVVGLLYLLRRGVVVHNVTVLPKMTELRAVLPLEQHLVTIFNIRSKIITEAENVIKFNLRNISFDVLHLLHMPM